MTAHLDRWDDDGVRFVFGYDANPAFVERAGSLPEQHYFELERRATEAFRVQERDKKPRAKPARVKEQIVEERGYRNLVLIGEDVAEFEHQPSKAKRPYRIVVLRKLIPRSADSCVLLSSIGTSSTSPTTVTSPPIRSLKSLTCAAIRKT
ncbi:MAG: hypothetical protein HC938_14150 [Nitrospira sp.]|nr:hypothetical protein [Nitrospira sp.]